MVSSLVYALACTFKPFRKGVVDALRGNPHLLDTPLPLLFRYLLKAPLQDLRGLSPPRASVIVVDALDELEESKDLASVLLEFSTLLPWLKVFVTSRPEVGIRYSFERKGEGCVRAWDLGSSDFAEVSNDIRLFMKYSLEKIRQSHYHLPPGWPHEEAVSALTQRANGLFIWASTAVRFLDIRYADPDRRLQHLLRQDIDGSSGPLQMLDSLYMNVIVVGGQSDTNFHQAFQDVMGTIVASRSFLTKEVLNAFVGNDDIVQNVLNRLSSVLSSGSGTQEDTIRLYHASFFDFLTSPDRGSTFFIDLQWHTAQLAYKCLAMMRSKLTFNICHLESSYCLNREVVDLKDKMKAIPAGLRYSCLRWASQLSYVSKDSTQFNHILVLIRHFFNQPLFLYWLETLSILGELQEGVIGLSHVASWIDVRLKFCL